MENPFDEWMIFGDKHIIFYDKCIFKLQISQHNSN